MRCVFAIALFAWLLGLGSVAQAQSVYTFAGALSDASEFHDPEPLWPFAPGQGFTGLLTLDETLIASQSVLDLGGGATRTYFNSPVVSLTYFVDSAGGGYQHTAPSGAYATYSEFADAGGNVTARLFEWQNYPLPFGGDPYVPVPPSERIGSYAPHAHFLYFAEGQPGVFFARFSDPEHWTPGAEHLDGQIYGAITSFSLVRGPAFRSQSVPEPATWALLLVGFGLVGGALRWSGRRRGVNSYA
jgi:hypothetical protein